MDKNWNEALLIYCLRNSSRKMSHSDIARSIGIDLNEYIKRYNNYVSNHVFDACRKYVMCVNNGG